MDDVSTARIGTASQDGCRSRLDRAEDWKQEQTAVKHKRAKPHGLNDVDFSWCEAKPCPARWFIRSASAGLTGDSSHQNRRRPLKLSPIHGRGWSNFVFVATRGTGLEPPGAPLVVASLGHGGMAAAGFGSRSTNRPGYPQSSVKLSVKSFGEQALTGYHSSTDTFTWVKGEDIVGQAAIHRDTNERWAEKN